MLPLGLLGLALLSGFAGYQYSKAKNNNNNNSSSNTNTTSNSSSSDDSSKAKNVYNYYGINDGEYGDALFNSQKKKRNLFQDNNTQVTNTRRFV